MLALFISIAMSILGSHYAIPFGGIYSTVSGGLIWFGSILSLGSILVFVVQKLA